jgi:ATP-dependent DNA ligase
VQAALKNRHKQFVIDGEDVILGVDGYSDFNALHSGKRNEEVQLCAFDVLAMDGDDLRDLPLSLRKRNLQRLLARPRCVGATHLGSLVFTEVRESNKVTLPSALRAPKVASRRSEAAGGS